MIHNENCMCDVCIEARVRSEVAGRATKQLANDYIKRRGGSDFPQEVPAPQRPQAAVTRHRARTLKI
jgi:hypothetical protein